jgi:L-alanine-DL-glutamate epimerase-like enolase superfamily enzyme
MQDASGGYTYANALKVGRVLEKLNFTWFEEPIPDRQLGLLHRLDDELHLPLLVGETLSLGEMPELFRNKPFGYVRGDVLIKGGITGLQKAFALCDLFGANLEIHTAGTPLLDVANLHVACANKNCEYVELHHPIFRFGIKDSPLQADEKGYLHVPRQPGLGVTLDWDWIEDHTIELRNDGK